MVSEEDEEGVRQLSIQRKVIFSCYVLFVVHVRCPDLQARKSFYLEITFKAERLQGVQDVFVQVETGGA